MTPDTEIIEQLVWNGVTIELSYDPDWGGMSAMGPAHRIEHLVLRVLEPVGAPLPVTETGYRSQFLRPHEVDEAGGLAPFVRAWLDAEAQRPMWRRVQAAWRQLDLFDSRA